MTRLARVWGRSLCLLLLASCAAAPRPARDTTSASMQARPAFAERLPAAQGTAYAAQVAPGLLRGARPNAQTIAWLKQRGVRTVIDLRHARVADERAQVLAAGMRFEHLPMRASEAPSRAQIERFLSLATDASLRPMYVHCAQGVDRTGTMMAVYRMQIEGWSNQDALAEMTFFGAHRIWWDLHDFVRNFTPESRAVAAAH